MIKKNFAEVEVFGIPIAKLTMLETLLVVEDAIEKEEQLHHVVVNAGKIVAMQDNPDLRESVLGADLINADGMAVVWAANLVGKNLPERVAGIDLMENLVE
ncbi:MAG: WecB/TagA/CpsF family glycosyltransferase, partial [Flavobacteriales bacterium]